MFRRHIPESAYVIDIRAKYSTDLATGVTTKTKRDGRGSERIAKSRECFDELGFVVMRNALTYTQTSDLAAAQNSERRKPKGQISNTSCKPLYTLQRRLAGPNEDDLLNKSISGRPFTGTGLTTERQSWNLPKVETAVGMLAVTYGRMQLWLDRGFFRQGALTSLERNDVLLWSSPDSDIRAVELTPLKNPGASFVQTTVRQYAEQ